MKFFKKTTAAVMCTALTLTSVPAFAAQADGTPDVSVQLNGEELMYLSELFLMHLAQTLLNMMPQQKQLQPFRATQPLNLQSANPKWSLQKTVKQQHRL